MGHVNPDKLSEFLKEIDNPLFCNGKKAEDFIFKYDKEKQKFGLYIQDSFMQWVSNDFWAKYSVI